MTPSPSWRTFDTMIKDTKRKNYMWVSSGEITILEHTMWCDHSSFQVFSSFIMRVSNSLSEKIKQNITNSSLQSHNMMFFFFFKRKQRIYMEREVLTIILSVRLVNTLVLFLFSPPSSWQSCFQAFLFVWWSGWTMPPQQLWTSGRQFCARKGQKLLWKFNYYHAIPQWLTHWLTSSPFLLPLA